MKFNKKLTLVTLIFILCVLPTFTGNSQDNNPIEIKNVIKRHIRSFSHTNTPWIIVEGTRIQKVFFWGRKSKESPEQTVVRVSENKHNIILIHKLRGPEYRINLNGVSGRNAKNLAWYSDGIKIKDKIQKEMPFIIAFYCDIVDAFATLPTLLEERSNVSIVGPKPLKLPNDKEIKIFEIKQQDSNIYLYVDMQTNQIISLKYVYPIEGVSEETIVFSDFRWSDGVLFPWQWEFYSEDRRHLGEFRITELSFWDEVDKTWFEKGTALKSTKRLLFDFANKKTIEDLKKIKLTDKQKKVFKKMEIIALEYAKKEKALNLKYPQDCPEKQKAYKALEEKLDKETDEILKELDTPDTK